MLGKQILALTIITFLYALWYLVHIKEKLKIKSICWLNFKMLRKSLQNTLYCFIRRHIYAMPLSTLKAVCICHCGNRLITTRGFSDYHWSYLKSWSKHHIYISSNTTNAADHIRITWWFFFIKFFKYSKFSTCSSKFPLYTFSHVN